MFFSEPLNLLFIACPKTGSTSVERFLLNLDPDGRRYRIDTGGKTYTLSDIPSGRFGHATAREFRNLLGAERFSGFHVFGFVRDPRERLVSTYFFKRGASVRQTFAKTIGPRRISNSLRSSAGIILARLLPFSIWVRVWPMKRCSDYFIDENGEIIVDFLGLTERLSLDLAMILKACGVQTANHLIVPHANKSKHDQASQYLSPLLSKYVEKRYSDDMRLFRLVEHGVFAKDSSAICDVGKQ